MKTYDCHELQKMVEQAIASLPRDREPRNLYQPIDYALGVGGKRVRPVLLLMAYNLYKDTLEEAMNAAVGVEIFHNFTLLHDDLMDHAEVRRGKPCVHVKWNQNTAILSGDNMLVLAFRQIMKCPPQVMPQVMDVFSQTAQLIDEGQQYDMDFEARNDVTEQEYLRMIELKTSVLLACALKMGALIAGAPERDAQTLYQFGIKLGLAFQLQDDYLDVYGDPAVFGKKIGGDILCNKKTFMLINALEHASGQERGELRCWLSARDFQPDEKIAQVTRIYDEIGVGQMAQKRMNEYFRQAMEYLDNLSIEQEKSAGLRSLAESMLHRQN